MGLVVLPFVVSLADDDVDCATAGTAKAAAVKVAAIAPMSFVFMVSPVPDVRTTLPALHWDGGPAHRFVRKGRCCAHRRTEWLAGAERVGGYRLALSGFK